MTGRVVCLGEALIDFIASEPAPALAAVKAFVPAVGGSPANTAVALARLGQPVAFVGQVGTDPFGTMIVDTLAAAGVDVAGVSRDPVARTPIAFVALDERGHPDFVFFRNPGADQRLADDAPVTAALAGAGLLHTGSIFFTHNPSRATAIRALRAARAAGLWVTFDPNIRAAEWASADELRSVIRLASSLAHVVKLSAEDCAALGASDPLEFARYLLTGGTGLVVVTKGEHGCTAVTSRFSLDVPALRVAVVDTTGAGDAFMGGLIASLLGTGLLERLAVVTAAELAPVLRVASAVGALTTTRRGVIPALPTSEAVAECLRREGDSEAARIVDPRRARG